MTHVVRFHQIGGPEVLQIEELEVGAPGSGELRIRVEAIGLNRAEAMFRSGVYLEPTQLPARLGSATKLPASSRRWAAAFTASRLAKRSA